MRKSPPPTIEAIAADEKMAEAARRTIARWTAEEGDCLVWVGRSVGSAPVSYFSGKQTTVRKMVLALEGRPLQHGSRWVVIDTCRTPGCVKAEHLKEVTRRSMVQRAGREGRLSLPNKCASLARVGRERAPKLTLEDARHIRQSTERSVVLAARYEVNESLIHRIRSGKVWKETAANASVFSWRPAA